MMYTFPKRLKIFSALCMLLGLLGLSYGFLSAPSSVEEAIEMTSSDHHEESDGNEENSSSGEHMSDQNHENDSSHGEHLLHKLQNKPWAALYVSAFFFMMISLGVLAFYAIQRAAQAGWPIVLYRVMEGITAYLFPGGIIVITILVLSGLHFNHLFIWMDPEVVAHDELIKNKSGYLNLPFFFIRAIFFLSGWTLYRYFSRKFSLKQDSAPSNDISNHKKNFKISAAFLVFYFVTESIMSWDWVMSIDPHWF